MNPNEITLWKMGVEEHNNILQNLIADRKKLKELMSEHLRTLFDDWEDIIFSQDFDVITIRFRPNFKLGNDSLCNIGMDWDVVASHSDNGHLTKSIKIYPFGRV